MISSSSGFLVYLLALYSASATNPPKVEIPTGKIEGKLEKSDVLKRPFNAFYSIPYAKPPIGKLRFKEPVPVEPWKGTLMATENPPMCPQMDMSNPVPPKAVGTEDCLYLNVFTPQLPDKNSKLLDVVFLIHGGGFMVSTSSHINVRKLLDKDVVVVTINYRLGALGFLSTEDLVSPGNNGLKDQRLALKWTKENIAHFGGDPNKITLSGCSAGGASVHYHLLSKASKGLFQKAIPESGSALNPWAFKESENPKKEAIKLATSLGCPTKCTEAMIECLKQRPADHITLKQRFDIFKLHPESQFVPSIEPPNPTAFLDKHPSEIMTQGEASDVPILFSFSRDEGLLFLMRVIGDPKALEKIEDNWEEAVVPLVTSSEVSKSRRNEIAEALKERYLKGKSIKDNKAGFVKMMSDWGFIAGIEEAAKQMAKVNKSPLYVYQFSYRGKVHFPMMALPNNDYEGVQHCEQTNYVTPFFGCSIPEDEPILDDMMALAMNFIKGKSLAGNWTPVKAGLPRLSIFTISTSEWNKNELEVYEDFANVQLWKSLRTDSGDSHNEL